MTSITVAEAKKNIDALLGRVYESHTPIQIVGEKHSGVLITEEDWWAIQETLYRQSMPGMKKSIRNSMVIPVEECNAKAGW